jgi:hypothetical protein
MLRSVVTKGGRYERRAVEMIDSKSVRRTLLLITALAACAAPNAAARVADAPMRGVDVSTLLTHQGVPPRVDAIGAQPSHQSDAPAVPITQTSDGGGFGWLSAGIGAAALLSVALLGAAAWTTVHRRAVTRPGGSA